PMQPCFSSPTRYVSLFNFPALVSTYLDALCQRATIPTALTPHQMPTKKLSTSAHQFAIPSELVERRIYLIRGQKVMLDSDLAELYGVPTKRLNEQVKRNRKRFPLDFIWQLTVAEMESLRSQIATSNQGRGGRRYTPFVFTEQGVAMLSSVLNSE